ncbi:MAG TPA: pantetheine-phosphate adenylyltransferase [Patescibacteria group bacterium]|nr:pantetheine-phosphate adenylyltransferase [Patescibacteria group bacterium]
MKKYRHVVVGGTFDHLHVGQKKLIAHVHEIGKTVTIGITHSDLAKRKVLHPLIEPLAIRKKNVTDYLDSLDADGVYHIVDLHDIYGRTLEDHTIDAILATEETHENVEKINHIRQKKGWMPLAVELFPLVRGADGQVIHSSRIRAGEIDREGFPFGAVFAQKAILHLPIAMRRQLRRPIGLLIRGKDTEREQTIHEVIALIEEKKPFITIAVGDIVSFTMKKAGKSPDVSIVDGKTRRTIIGSGLFVNTNSIRCVNEAGTVSRDAAHAVKNIIASCMGKSALRVLHVQGEEDLLVLPAILSSPLSSMVLYGQHDEGVVVVEVTEEKKQEIKAIMSQFE